MELEVINSMAKREVLKTSRFTSLIKSGNCSAYKRTSGDTAHSVNAIKQIAYSYLSQTEKLAKALLGNNLAETVQNNYRFLYTHYQYEADPELQQMRSPICSWSDRFKGIDCKSFSITASTLLLNQNIVHYIRRIKQPSYQPNYWTHVYIVVPIDQKTFNLQKGYYVIDGTRHTNTEGPIAEKEDTLMSNLPHVWLNGSPQQLAKANNSQINEMAVSVNKFNSFLQELANKGVSASVITTIYTTINQSLSANEIPYLEIKNNALSINGSLIDLGVSRHGLNISLDDLSGVFGAGWSPSCIGGAYDKQDLDYSKPIIVEGFNSIYDAFNEALATKNFSLILQKVNDVLAHSKAFEDHTKATAGYRWNSRCSKDITAAFRSMGKFYGDIAYKAFYGYLQQYFDFNTDFKSVSNTSYPFNTQGNNIGLFKTQFVRNIEVIKVNNFKAKGNDIPFFEITPYAIENSSSEGFNLENFINTLSSVAIQFQGNNNPNPDGTNNPNPDGTNNGNTNQPLPNNTVSKAGFGIVQGVLLTGLVLGTAYAVKNNKANTASKKNKSNA